MTPPPSRIAAGWFLGSFVAALLVFAWLRGAARVAIPLAIAALVVVGIGRFLRMLRAPVD